ncbi:MAG: hypothetical protein IK104_01500 [Clostridia bacterium]|nr:hypothetical protein [Clostridia bacterium]
MNTFSELTALIPSLKNDSYGEWIVDKKNDGSPGHPKQMPYVRYTAAVDRFIETLFRFCDAHPEYEHTHYLETLEQYGVLSANDPKPADISRADAKLVIALLVRSVRAERFCDGALLGFCKDGTVVRCLERLASIDRETNA